MKVSVALCTYNGEKYVEEQLKTIMAQTRRPDEIVVSDDGSSDRTIEIVDSVLKGSEIEHLILKNVGTHGVVGNFYNAMSNCSGDVIFTSDQDDMWREDKVEVMLRPFEESEKNVLAFSNALLVDGEGRSLGGDLWSTLSFKPEKEKDDMFGLLLNRCVVTGAAMAVRKSLFELCGIAPKGWLHDGWLAVNAVILGNVCPIDEELLFYRQHGNNVVGAKKLTSMQRVKGYFKNGAVMAKTRQERQLRYTAVLDFASERLSEKNTDSLKKCVEFWEGTTKFVSLSKARSVAWIMKNLFNGSYKRYYTGARGAVRDIFTIFGGKN